VGSIDIQKVNIACQYKPTQNITEMFLFDLQTVAFLVLKNARRIAAIEPFQKESSASSHSVIAFTYKSLLTAMPRSRGLPIERDDNVKDKTNRSNGR
jgi:hypothetical protein